MTSIPDTQKKRGRGRPPSGGQMPGIMVRMPPADLARLDAHIAAQPEPKPSRPEAIRRVLAERFSTEDTGKTAASADVAEKDAKARSKAAIAADREMSDLDAPAEVKASRRKALTEKPAMVAKARANRTKG